MSAFKRDHPSKPRDPRPTSLVHTIETAKPTYDDGRPVRVWIDGVLVGHVADRFIMLEEPSADSRYRSMLCIPGEQLRVAPLVSRFKGESILAHHLCELVVDESQSLGNLKVFVGGLAVGHVGGEVGRALESVIRLASQQPYARAVDRIAAACSVTVFEGYRQLGFLGMNVAADQASVCLQLVAPDGINGSWSIGSTEP